jgi:hypothetical protein
MLNLILRLRHVVHPRRPARRQRPLLECLEERCLLDGSGPIIPNLPATPQLVANTVPPNGDVNPYGVAFVPRDFAPGGPLHPGDILVSNFNDASNVQGTGTTIVDVSPSGNTSVFFQGQAGLGLTTALGILKRGFVLVGNLPTDSNGNPQQGSLLILDRFGNIVANLTDPKLLDGPWDLTVNDQGERAQVFVSNVLSGTVTRLDLQLPVDGKGLQVQMVQIASGNFIRPDPAALVVGPTGLVYDAPRDLLYVASTGDNTIFAVSNARRTTSDEGTGSIVYQDQVHLHGPLGLVQAPNGDLISTQGDAVNPDPTQNSEIVEFTPAGQFVAQVPVDSSGMAGGAFGIALAASGNQIRFAAVDDINNTLEVWTIQPAHGQNFGTGDTAALRVLMPSTTGSLIVSGASHITLTDAADKPSGQVLRLLPALPTAESGRIRLTHRTAVDQVFSDWEAG